MQCQTLFYVILYPTHKVNSSLGTYFAKRSWVVETILPAEGGRLFDAV